MTIIPILCCRLLSRHFYTIQSEFADTTAYGEVKKSLEVIHHSRLRLYTFLLCRIQLPSVDTLRERGSVEFHDIVIILFFVSSIILVCSLRLKQ